jgi:hypothetical protein
VDFSCLLSSECMNVKPCPRMVSHDRDIDMDSLARTALLASHGGSYAEAVEQKKPCSPVALRYNFLDSLPSLQRLHFDWLALSFQDLFLQMGARGLLCSHRRGGAATADGERTVSVSTSGTLCNAFPTGVVTFVPGPSAGVRPCSCRHVSIAFAAACQALDR